MTLNDDSFDFARYQLMWELCVDLRKELMSELVSSDRIEGILRRMALLIDGDVISRMDRIVAISKSENLKSVWKHLKAKKEFHLELKEYKENEKEELE